MSKDDPLASFRGDGMVKEAARTIAQASQITPPATFRKISQSATSDQMAGDPHFYAAFGQGDRSQERLEIRRVLGEWHAPSYRYLMDVMYNGKFGTELILVFSFLLVKIKGRNLQALNAAILEGTCTFVQDYHQNEFSTPAAGAPVITDLEIVVRGE